jgi:membrane-anchored protein YejM (alkaline phosphatase superfamily)
VIQESGNDWRDWPHRDQRALLRVQDLLNKAGDRPQFVMVFLMSTHFPYAFPPEWDMHRPSAAEMLTEANWKSFDAGVLYNRYRNAALSLEEGLMRLIGSLDPTRHIVVVTGDHGESMSEDGALAHNSRGSEVQTRVPLLMVGPGLPPRVIEQPTTHSDVLPTLLHALAGREVKIRHSHGRDVLGPAPLSEQVMICPFRWKDPYDLILIRGSDRMQFKIRLDRAVVETLGFCDTSGNLALDVQRRCAPQDAVLWTEAFRRELLRIARGSVAVK